MFRVLLALAIAVMMVAMVSSANGPDGDARRPDDAAGGVTPDPATIRRVVEATAAIERARVELQTVYVGLGRLRDAPPGVDQVRMVQRAAFDRPAGQARAEGDMSELATVLETTDESVPGDYSLPTRFVVDGETVYAQIGPMARAIGLEPTSWIRRDLAGFADQSVDNETAALLLDPLGMVSLLARPVKAVRGGGDDEVRGVATTRLTVTVDLTPRAGAGPVGNGEAASNGSAAGAGAGGELEARFHAIGVDELPVDVWVDGGDVVRRLEFRLAAGGGDVGQRGGVTTTFDVYDVGEPVDIAIPDAADVVDQADLPTRLDP